MAESPAVAAHGAGRGSSEGKGQRDTSTYKLQIQVQFLKNILAFYHKYVHTYIQQYIYSYILYTVHTYIHTSYNSSMLNYKICRRVFIRYFLFICYLLLFHQVACTIHTQQALVADIMDSQIHYFQRLVESVERAKEKKT